jgi:hypothetical protein
MTRLTQRRRNPRNPQVDTPAFKRWFGTSQVVAARGEPLVVYHGSPKDDIEVFEQPRHRQRVNGFFFSDDDEVAGEYGTSVYPVYLHMLQPLVVDAKGADWSEIPPTAVKMRGWSAENKKTARGFMANGASTDVIAELAQALGFDGAIIKNVIDSSSGDTYVPTTVYVVFDPHQIKSANMNAGTFDPSDPSILRNPRRSPTTAPRTLALGGRR